MSEIKKTAIFLVLAILFVAAGILARPAEPERRVVDDSGERFFAAFDPLDARSLEIVSFDEDHGRTNAFKVAHVGGVWSIPSHENYPADAKDQLAGAAAAIADLIKGSTVSDSAMDHERYDVLDPTTETAALSGLGTRVTIADEGGKALADIVIGAPVKDQEGLRYVRVPGRDRVYIASLDTKTLTTRFEDWIEEDLLQLDSWDIRQIVVNDYSIDEVNQRIVQKDVLELSYDDESRKWTLAGLAEAEELDLTAVNEMKRALDDLKIVSVHRKPSGLGAELRADDALQLDASAVSSLQSRGFYISKGTLVSNQGETTVRMKDAVTYALRFGEIALGETAGLGLVTRDEAAPDEEEDEGTARYLFVMASFDAGMLPEPALEEVPALPEGAPETVEEGTEEAPEIATIRRQRERILASNERLTKEHGEAVAKAHERVRQLNDRFADWYYVISDSVYQKIRVGREGLVKATSGEPAAPAGPLPAGPLPEGG
jgi:hypothetical protein